MSGDTEAREGEALYVLRADYMRYVRTVGFDKYSGRPLNEPKRYEKGDLISLSEDEAERYLRSGAMVSAEDFDPEEQADLDAKRRAEADKVLSSMTADPNRAGQTSGHLVGLEDAAPETKPDGDGASDPIMVDGIEVEDIEDVKDPDADPDADGDAPAGDGYEDMSYPELVQTAKAKTNNGGGTKEELIARLREHDANEQ